MSGKQPSHCHTITMRLDKRIVLITECELGLLPPATPTLHTAPPRHFHLPLAGRTSVARSVNAADGCSVLDD